MSEITGAMAVKRFIEHWSYQTKPHITVDAGVATVELLEYCTNKDVLITMGFNSHYSGEVWRLLKQQISGNSWTAAMNRKGFMASVRIFTTSPLEKQQVCTYHHLMTNAYRLPRFNSTIVRAETMLKYSEDELWRKTVKELKDILERHGLKKSDKNKSELISKIMFTCNKIPQGVDGLLNQLKKGMFTSHASHHEYYKKNFNGVDLIDKRFYEQHYPYAINNWRTKMLLSIMTDVVISSFSASNECRCWDSVLFRKVLSECLCTAREGVFL